MGHDVLIVGTGLIGTSIALALRESASAVFLFDADPAAVATAAARGAGRPLTDGDQPDLIVIATPPRNVGRVASEYLAQFPHATVTDVASVKAKPLKRVRDRCAENGADPRRFVGGHPMAGRETSGPTGARADLFEDRLWVITPTDDNPAECVNNVRWLASACGSLVIELTADEHDRAVALTSHTPQLLASLLAAELVDADPADIAVSGQGLRDMTRLAASQPELWSDILAGNGAEVSVILERLSTEMAAIVVALREVAAQPGLTVDDEVLVPVHEVLVKGNAGRDALPDKHGGTAHDYETIPVVVDDRPGELSRLFVAAGDAGVNLEDVRIEHTVGRLMAIVELDVTPTSSDALRAVLQAGGWQIRG